MKRIALIAALAIAGSALIGQGAWIHAKAMLAQVLLNRAFAQTIATGHPVKPWSWADTWPVAKIEVPRLAVSEIVLAGSSGQALAFGPGQVETSANVGEPGVVVYSAHRDTHFRFLKDVKVDDMIAVTRKDGEVFLYRVTHTSVVRFDQSGIDPHADGKFLVLTTCWPFDAVTPGPERYVVYAEIVDESDIDC
jgi:sortase A